MPSMMSTLASPRSQSTTRTFRPCAARVVARLIVTKVLPTPPLPLVTVAMRGRVDGLAVMACDLSPALLRARFEAEQCLTLVSRHCPPLAILRRSLCGVADAILSGLLGPIQFTIGLFEEFFNTDRAGWLESGEAEACRDPHGHLPGEVGGEFPEAIGNADAVQQRRGGHDDGKLVAAVAADEVRGTQLF